MCGCPIQVRRWLMCVQQSLVSAAKPDLRDEPDAIFTISDVQKLDLNCWDRSYLAFKLCHLAANAPSWPCQRLNCSVFLSPL